MSAPTAGPVGTEDDPRALLFVRHLSAVRVAFWWVLFVVDCALGLVYWRRTPNARRWLLYKSILGVNLLLAIKAAAYLSYVDAVTNARDDIDSVSGAYIFFANLAGAAFIALARAGGCLLPPSCHRAAAPPRPSPPASAHAPACTAYPFLPPSLLPSH